MTDKPDSLTQILLRQLQPSFRMLEKVVAVCPKSLWAQKNIDPPIWQQIYHVLYALDYWFSESKEAFKAPVFKDEVNSVLGEESKGFIDQEDMVGYLQFVEKKTMKFLNEMTEKDLTDPSSLYQKWSNLDVVLEQLRHLQHHLGYLNRVLLKCKLQPVDWDFFEN